ALSSALLRDRAHLRPLRRGDGVPASVVAQHRAARIARDPRDGALRRRPPPGVALRTAQGGAAMAVKREEETFERPAFDVFERMPGLDVGLTTAEKLLSWGARNSLWLFPMATSCCG